MASPAVVGDAADDGPERGRLALRLAGRSEGHAEARDSGGSPRRCRRAPRPCSPRRARRGGRRRGRGRATASFASGADRAAASVGGDLLAVDEDDDLADPASAVREADAEPRVLRGRAASTSIVGKSFGASKAATSRSGSVLKPRCFARRPGVVVALLQLVERDGLVPDDPVEPLDVPAVAGVEAARRVHDRPGAVAEGDERAELRPVAASQRRVVAVGEPVRMCAPSGENTAEIDPAGVPLEAPHLPAARRLPEARGLVPARGQDVGAVRGEHARDTRLGVPLEAPHLPAGRRLPQARGLVLARGQDVGAVRREHGGGHPLGVPLEAPHLLARSPSPTGARSCPRSRSGRGRRPARTRRRSPRRSAPRSAGPPAARRLPEARGLVLARGQYVGAVRREHGGDHAARSAPRSAALPGRSPSPRGARSCRCSRSGRGRRPARTRRSLTPLECPSKRRTSLPLAVSHRRAVLS